MATGTRETEHRTGEPPGTDDPVPPVRRSPALTATGSRPGGRNPGSRPRVPRRSAGPAVTTGGAR
ncbi:hypothetical protein GCM10018953_75430 [Streptosporangium nondiastaticum]|uniref:Uncharacterized protein n=1 Tax=Streptosporangium sandarakinum TaxID=1260955 RepID=A0A852URB2_9ACTN|nr:hypothetical protein [Streptosporangium sandarakinum]